MSAGKKKQSSFTMRQGILLLVVLGIFFAVVFLLAYYVQAKLGWSLQ
jgi:ABC-type thiamin/hydroxymethylpyrimidine transport system permease subunit